MPCGEGDEAGSHKRRGRTERGQEIAAGGAGNMAGNKRAEYLAEAEGGSHQREGTARRKRRKLAAKLQPERGDGDDRDAKQHAGDERSGITANRDAGDDAYGLGDAGERIGSGKTDACGKPVGQPDRGDCGEAVASQTIASKEGPPSPARTMATRKVAVTM